MKIRFYKEIDENNKVIGICSSSYLKEQQMNWYAEKKIQAIEISEKEYDILRKGLN